MTRNLRRQILKLIHGSYFRDRQSEETFWLSVIYFCKPSDLSPISDGISYESAGHWFHIRCLTMSGSALNLLCRSYCLDSHNPLSSKPRLTDLNRGWGWGSVRPAGHSNLRIICNMSSEPLRNTKGVWIACRSENRRLKEIWRLAELLYQLFRDGGGKNEGRMCKSKDKPAATRNLFCLPQKRIWRFIYNLSFLFLKPPPHLPQIDWAGNEKGQGLGNEELRTGRVNLVLTRFLTIGVIPGNSATGVPVPSGVSKFGLNCRRPLGL